MDTQGTRSLAMMQRDSAVARGVRKAIEPRYKLCACPIAYIESFMSWQRTVYLMIEGRIALASKYIELVRR